MSHKAATNYYGPVLRFHRSTVYIYFQQTRDIENRTDRLFDTQSNRGGMISYRISKQVNEQTIIHRDRQWTAPKSALKPCNKAEF